MAAAKYLLVVLMLASYVSSDAVAREACEAACAVAEASCDLAIFTIPACIAAFVACEAVCQAIPERSIGFGNPALNECGIRSTNGIGNGQAQLGEFPWMVALLDKANNYVGGASLVHPRVVLTAAHKVHEKVANNLVARIGDWDLSNTDEDIPHQNIDVAQILVHPTFDRQTLVNDIALLILQSDATLSDTVMPICLPQPDTNFDQSSCIVTGWSKDVFGTTGKNSKILKEVSVPAVSHGECQRMLRNTRLGTTFTLHNSFNCAGGNGENSCTGDGGSPLVCPNPNNPNEYVQMGVVAWGIGCGVVGNPGVYGSIPQAVVWISHIIQQQPKPQPQPQAEGFIRNLTVNDAP